MDKMKEKVFIFGAGGHTKVIIDIIEKENVHELVCVLDDDKNLWGTTILDYPIKGGKNQLQTLKQEYPEIKAIIGIGENKVREKIYNILKGEQFEFARTIHPSAQIARNVTIGSGTVIMANTAINTDSIIGINCIINTGTTIDHENIIEDYVHLSPGVHLSGNVVIKKAVHMGTGSNVIPGITIGSYTIIGAGTTVIKDIPNNVTAVGIPAKIIKHLD